MWRYPWGVTLRLYDSATHAERDFVPRTPGKVGIYLCGATVQSGPHVGHLRSAIAFDVLVRWLRRSGLEVTLVRNVTDIDDKILAKAGAASRPWWAWAYEHELAFTRAYQQLGVLPPTYEPRATGHVPDMIELIARLMERGHAYVGEPGNVYFDVASFPDYGALTRQVGSEDAESEASDKRNPRDFALWKAPREGEPPTAAWETPWGRGRPGWHLECSAMAHRYLGSAFDIHAGGIDLRFPHHENEQAQSRAAGDEFAGLWMHNAWVTQAGEKMSKSLGNYLSVTEVLERSGPAVTRLALASVHYRSTLEFSDEVLAESATTWERLGGFATRATERVGQVRALEVAESQLPEDFTAAMDDDLNVSAALAAVHAAVRRGNTALTNNDDDALREQLIAVRAMLDVLGLDPLSEQWQTGTPQHSGTQRALEVMVEATLEQRAAARAAKDWQRADALRDQLAHAGIVVEDGAGQVRWQVKG